MVNLFYHVKIGFCGNRGKSVAIAIALLMAVMCAAQESRQQPSWDVSAATGVLFYQSAYSLKNSIGLEIAAGKFLKEEIFWETGMRLGFNPTLPEGFVRIGAQQRVKSWRPSFALETGITNRAYFSSDTKLLKETREAMLDDIGHLYLSAHIEWLSFEFRNRWTASVIELDLGTHYKDFGKTLRFQSTLIRVRKML